MLRNFCQNFDFRIYRSKNHKDCDLRIPLECLPIMALRLWFECNAGEGLGTELVLFRPSQVFLRAFFTDRGQVFLHAFFALTLSARYRSTYWAHCSWSPKAVVRRRDKASRYKVNWYPVPPQWLLDRLLRAVVQEESWPRLADSSVFDHGETRF